MVEYSLKKPIERASLMCGISPLPAWAFSYSRAGHDCPLHRAGSSNRALLGRYTNTFHRRNSIWKPSVILFLLLVGNKKKGKKKVLAWCRLTFPILKLQKTETKNSQKMTPHGEHTNRQKLLTESTRVYYRSSLFTIPQLTSCSRQLINTQLLWMHPNKQGQRTSRTQHSV